MDGALRPVGPPRGAITAAAPASRAWVLSGCPPSTWALSTWALSTWALAALAGCAPAPTELVVVVDTDLGIPSELDEVIVEVTGPGGSTERESSRLASSDPLPMTVGVSPSGDSLGPIEVVATGRHAGAIVATRTHRVTLVRGESRVLRMHLSRACVGVACASGSTCGEQGCVPVDVDPEDLSPWTGSAPRLASDGGVPRDGSLGSDGGDAAIACGTASDCDDGNPCTDDSCTGEGCAHAPNDAACDDGAFCTGLDHCAGGTCTGGGDPCTGTTTSCDEVMDVCAGCATTTADCPDALTGAWTSCDFRGSACGESGIQSRAVVAFTCVSGACVPHETTEDQPCSRDTDGMLCASRSCPDWGACGGFGSTCGESGTMSRTCSEGACTAGTCTTRMVPESMPCSRDTDGTVCEPAACGGWSGCNFPDDCAIDGTQTRRCNDDVRCAGGSCPSVRSYTDSRDCSRASTDGIECAAPSCDAWSACAGPAGSCDPAGTQTRTCTPTLCGGGACGAAGTAYTETQACSRSVVGLACDDGDTCTRPDTCSAPGVCSGTFCFSCCGAIP